MAEDEDEYEPDNPEEDDLFGPCLCGTWGDLCGRCDQGLECCCTCKRDDDEESEDDEEDEE